MEDRQGNIEPCVWYLDADF